MSTASPRADLPAGDSSPAQKSSSAETEAQVDAREQLQLRKKLGSRRYYLVTYPDGKAGYVHIPSRTQQDEDQAMADFLGVSIDRTATRSIRSMASILGEIDERLQLREESFAAEILAEAWKKAMGDFFSTQAELFSLSDGLATIRTLHPNIRFEINRMRTQVIRKLNDQLGAGSVKKIRIIHS